MIAPHGAEIDAGSAAGGVGQVAGRPFGAFSGQAAFKAEFRGQAVDQSFLGQIDLFKLKTDDMEPGNGIWSGPTADNFQTQLISAKHLFGQNNSDPIDLAELDLPFTNQPQPGG